MIEDLIASEKFICPDCHKILYSKKCICKWELEFIENIPIFLSTNDKKNSIFKDYQKNYDIIAKDDLRQSIQEETYITNQINKLYSYLPTLKDKTILEVGVGQGRLFKKMQTSGCKQVVGLDIAIDYLKEIKKTDKTNLIIGNAENLPFREEFEILIATDILEHVLNVGDFLISLQRSLKKGGMLIIKVPYKEDLRQYAQKNGCAYQFVHLRTFTKDLLNFTLKESGFKIKKIHYDGWYIDKARCKIFKNFTSDLALKAYGNVKDVSRFPNWLGRMLMRPIEITILAQRN